MVEKSFILSSWLSPEAREDARVVAKRIWAQGMKMLNGKNSCDKKPSGQCFLEFSIFRKKDGDESYNPFGADLIVRKIAEDELDEKGRRGYLLEVFYIIIPEKGGICLKEVWEAERSGRMPASSRAITREPFPHELEDLLEAMRELEEKKSLVGSFSQQK